MARGLRGFGASSSGLASRTRTILGASSEYYDVRLGMTNRDAIVTICRERSQPERGCYRIALADDLPQREDDVRRSLREASHVPWIPGFAIRDEVTNEVALAGEAALLVHADSVQHLD